MTFKEKLVILRKSKGLTQDDFASAVGVSRQAVYKWESGQSYPEVPKLLEMKLLFTISIDELLDDNYDIPLPDKKKRKRASKENVAAKAVIKESLPKAEPVKEAAPAPKAEPVKEAASAPKAEPVKEATSAPKAEPVKEAAPAPKAEPIKEEVVAKIDTVPSPEVKVSEEPSAITLEDLQPDEDNAKKSSFFDRLFGRR